MNIIESTILFLSLSLLAFISYSAGRKDSERKNPFIDIILDTTDGQKQIFIEVENSDRKSISIGYWIDIGENQHALRIYADEILRLEK